MKYSHKFIWVLFLWIGGLSVASAQTQKNLLNKTYKVSGDTKLYLDNTFGKITVATWNKSDIQVKVDVIVDGYSDRKTEQLLDAVSIDESSSNSSVSVKTEFKNNMNSNKGQRFEINYEVYMPKSNPLDVENSFGDFVIQDFDGPIKLELEYGKLAAGNLKEVDMELAFGSGDVESITNGKIEVEYYDHFNLGAANDLELENAFSKTEIEKVRYLDVDSKYGKLKLGDAVKVEGDIRFSGFSIDYLAEELDVQVQYVSGGMEVERISKDFTKVEIEAKFSSVELNFEDGHAIPFETKHSFSDLEYSNSQVSFTKKIKEDFNKHYVGTLGAGSQSKGSVYVTTSYGNLEIDLD
jgi:hypothetical protein